MWLVTSVYWPREKKAQPRCVYIIKVCTALTSSHCWRWPPGPSHSPPRRFPTSSPPRSRDMRRPAPDVPCTVCPVHPSNPGPVPSSFSLGEPPTRNRSSLFRRTPPRTAPPAHTTPAAHSPPSALSLGTHKTAFLAPRPLFLSHAFSSQHKHASKTGSAVEEITPKSFRSSTRPSSRLSI